MILAAGGPELFDVALVDLAWGLAIAAVIGAVGGFIYTALTSPPPSDERADPGPGRPADLGDQ